MLSVSQYYSTEKLFLLSQLNYTYTFSFILYENYKPWSSNKVFLF